MSVFLEAVASVLIFMLRGTSSPSCCVCLCLCEAGVQMVSVQLQVEVSEHSHVFLQPLRVPV